MDFAEWQRHFDWVDDALSVHQDLWQLAPFCEPELPWTHTYPALSYALLQLDDAHAWQLDNDHQALLQFISRYIPDMQVLKALPVLTPPSDVPCLPERWSVDIPGRKWQQIQHFIHALDNTKCEIVWLDWCAGKSHLGRNIVRQSGGHLVAVEREPSLCNAGKQAAQKAKISAEFISCDVLEHAMECVPWQKIDYACALHACGDLHRVLLDQLVLHNVKQISLSPCCYHLQKTEIYQPLSAYARRSRLCLSRADLHVAVEETVTSSRRIQQQRDTMMCWRLAFDVWQRENRSRSDYLTTPSRPYSILQKGYSAFMHDLCAHHQLVLPDADALRHCLVQGQERWRQVQRLQLLRHLFRPVLERWLLLDRVLYLAEHGYQVQLRQFCERRITPRNHLIQAKK